MKLDQTIIMDEADLYEAFKDYLFNKMSIDRGTVCQIIKKSDSTFAVILSQKEIKG